MRLIDADFAKERIRKSDLTNQEKIALMLILEDIPTLAPPPNDPLTLEELQEMDGEPVYVTSSIGEQPMWYIVDIEDRKLKNPWDRITLEEWDEGYPYKAYRRRPESGAP